MSDDTISTPEMPVNPLEMPEMPEMSASPSLESMILPESSIESPQETPQETPIEYVPEAPSMPMPESPLAPNNPAPREHVATSTPVFRGEAGRSMARGNRLNKIAEHCDKILTLVREKGTLTNRDIVKHVHVSDATASRYLQTLVARGDILRTGKGRSTVYTKK